MSGNADTSGQYAAMTTGQWQIVREEPELRLKKVLEQTLDALRGVNEKFDELIKAKQGDGQQP